MTIEEIVSKIENLSDELHEIFTSITYEKEISPLRICLLQMKCILINNKKEEYDKSYQRILDENEKLINKIRKWLYFLIPCGFIPILSIIPFLILVKIYLKYFTLSEVNKNFELEEKFRNISIGYDNNYNNCERFLSARVDDVINKCETDKEMEKEYSIVLDTLEILDDYFKTGNVEVIKAKINDDNKDIMKSLLQGDLQTDEENLDELLRLYKEKIDNENNIKMLEEVGKGRIRAKSTKKVEKSHQKKGNE